MLGERSGSGELCAKQGNSSLAKKSGNVEQASYEGRGQWEVGF